MWQPEIAFVGPVPKKKHSPFLLCSPIEGEKNATTLVLDLVRFQVGHFCGQDRSVQSYSKGLKLIPSVAGTASIMICATRGFVIRLRRATLPEFEACDRN